jgi:hypothetical protein
LKSGLWLACRVGAATCRKPEFHAEAAFLHGDHRHTTQLLELNLAGFTHYLSSTCATRAESVTDHRCLTMNQPTDPPSIAESAARATHALKRGRERHVAGAYAEAAAYFREASALRQSAFGATDPRTLEAVRHEAAALAALGELEAAAELQARAVEGSAEAASRSRSRLAEDAAALARLRARQREWNDAARLWLVALRERRATLGADHQETLAALAQLANAWQSGGYPARAERAWRRLLEAREAAGAPAADIAAVRERIADCLAASDRRGEALTERLRAMSERSPSPAPADATRVAPRSAARPAANVPATSSGDHTPSAGGPDALADPPAAPASQTRATPLALRILALAERLNSGIVKTLRGGTGGAPDANARGTRRRLLLVALGLFLVVCAVAITRYEMSRAEQQALFEAERREYLAPPAPDVADEDWEDEEYEEDEDPPPSLGAPSTEVYRPQ